MKINDHNVKDGPYTHSAMASTIVEVMLAKAALPVDRLAIAIAEELEKVYRLPIGRRGKPNR